MYFLIVKLSTSEVKTHSTSEVGKRTDSYGTEVYLYASSVSGTAWITKARLRNEEEIWWRNATKKEIDEREQEEAKVRGTYTLALRDPRVYL